MSQYDQPLSGETDQAKPYEPTLRDFPMPKTEKFSEGENAEREELIKEALTEVEAKLDNKRKEKYCEDIVGEIQRIGGVLTEKGFGSRPEDKHIVVSDQTRSIMPTYVQYETAVVARFLHEGDPTGALNQWATEDQIFKGSECKITDPYDEEQYKNAQQEGINISVVTGPATKVYSGYHESLPEDVQRLFLDHFEPGTVLVSAAGQCKSGAMKLHVGSLSLGGIRTSDDLRPYELVLAAMQDTEAELLAGEEKQ